MGKTLKEMRVSLGQSQNLTSEEAHSVIENVKLKLDSGNYTISPKLESTLKFMGQTKKGLKSAINLLDKNHYKKSYDDYRGHYNNAVYKQTVYFFEKNDTNDERKVYLKFALDRKSKDRNLNLITYGDNSLIGEGINPDQDVSKILNNPSFFNVDLLGRAADKAAYIVKEKMGQGKYKLPSRVKYGIQQMGYSYGEFKEIMTSLTKRDYISGPEPVRSDKDNPYHVQSGGVFVFGPHDPKKNKDLYIKFVIDEGSSDVYILSFYERMEGLGPFFKELQ